MPTVTPLIDKRIETADKMQSAVLKKGEPCELPPALFEIYKQTYGDLGVNVEPEAVEETTKDDSQRLVAIAQAISDTLSEGDDTKLTVDGDVRTNVISDIVGFKVTGDERDAAMELI